MSKKEDDLIKIEELWDRIVDQNSGFIMRNLQAAVTDDPELLGTTIKLLEDYLKDTLDLNSIFDIVVDECWNPLRPEKLEIKE